MSEFESMDKLNIPINEETINWWYRKQGKEMPYAKLMKPHEVESTIENDHLKFYCSNCMKLLCTYHKDYHGLHSVHCDDCGETTVNKRHYIK